MHCATMVLGDAMTEDMNHIKVQLKPTGRPEYTGSQDDECVTAMNSIPPGEIMP